MTNNKYFYYVITEKHPTQNKFYSYAKRLHSCNNLKFIFSDSKIIIAQPCATLKEAQKIADEWNNNFIKNGEFWQD